MAYAVELGYEVRPLEAWVRYENGRCLDGWYKRLRDAFLAAMDGLGVDADLTSADFLAAMDGYKARGPELAIVTMTIKATVRGGLGKLRERPRGEGWRPGEPWRALSRPTWRPDIRAAENAAPVEPVDVVARNLEKRFSASEVSFWLVDVVGQEAVRLPRAGTAAQTRGETKRVQLTGSVYDRVLRPQRLHEEPDEEDGCRLVAPVTNRGDCIGVLGLAVPERYGARRGRAGRARAGLHPSIRPLSVPPRGYDSLSSFKPLGHTDGGPSAVTEFPTLVVVIPQGGR